MTTALSPQKLIITFMGPTCGKVTKVEVAPTCGFQHLVPFAAAGEESCLRARGPVAELRAHRDYAAGEEVFDSYGWWGDLSSVRLPPLTTFHHARELLPTCPPTLAAAFALRFPVGVYRLPLRLAPSHQSKQGTGPPGQSEGVATVSTLRSGLNPACSDPASRPKHLPFPKFPDLRHTACVRTSATWVF